jgi:receptor protein-tyrosine kinase
MFGAGRSAEPAATGKQGQNNGVSNSLATVLDPTGGAAESYRTLRTNLFYALVDDPPRVIVMTSPGAGEGKSTTCANLGVVLAQAGKSTLILDCDLRRPQVHRVFGLRNLRGVTDILRGEAELSEVCQEPLPGLKTATAGSLPPNPTELVGSSRFAEIVSRARQTFDYVLIDAPPVEMVSDPSIIAVQADGVLLVLDAQNTRKGALRRSVRSLRTVGLNVLGTVMNNVNVSEGGYSRNQAYTYK